MLAWSPEYSLRSQDHAGELAGRTLYGSAHELLDAQGRILYSWFDLNADGEFCWLILHANGQQYLIFRQDFYGYSVLEVQSGRVLHYLQEQPWLEVNGLLDPAYEKYDDIDFAAWLPGEGLLLEGYDTQTEKKERLLLSVPTIRQELAQMAKALRQE